MLHIKIGMRAIGVQSVRGGKGRYYESQRVREYKEAISWEVRRQIPLNFKKYEDGIVVRGIYRYKGKGNGYRIKRPDLDSNINKGIMDAMSGIVWVDDAQIVEFWVTKLDADKDSIELYIWGIEELNDIPLQNVFVFPAQL